MKIFFISTRDMLCEPIHTGLQSLEAHDVQLFWYDRAQVPTDRAILDAADQCGPDLILYTGRPSGPHKPARDTLKRLRKQSPTVLIVHDATDKDWIPVLKEYRQHETFTVTVNIDGNDSWSKGPKDFTALTPIDPRFYPAPVPLDARPVLFGFAGGYASPSRAKIINYLIEKAGLVVPRRNETYGSYQAFADFMMSCRVVLNVPFSGHDTGNQVKGRVIETGLARACLLEQGDSPAYQWFNRGFVPYQNEIDAAKAVPMLLESIKATQLCADKLHEAVKAHAPAHFWKQVIERAMS